MKLNPFRGIPNKREVWAWGMYDLANQSFTLLINTLLLGVYVKEVVVPGEDGGDRVWAGMVSASLFLALLASPIAGAMADTRSLKKEFLIGTGVVCSALTCALALLGSGHVWLAVAIYVPANLAYNLGENFLASFLPQVATPRTMGRISAVGFLMGYSGALMLLIITAALMLGFGWTRTEDWGPLFVFAGAWFLLAAVPTMLFLKERRVPPGPLHGRNVVTASFGRVADTVRHARRFGQFMRFLGVFFVYSLGTQAVIFFAGIISKDLGFGNVKLVLFLLQLTVTAGVGAVIAARYQDRIGHRHMVLIFLSVWAFSTLALALMTLGEVQEWLFWVLANGVGLGLGGIGTSSRALVGLLTPEHRSGEFFGLWGMLYKLAGVVGPFAFGFLKGGTNGLAPALFMLAGFFIAGLLLMFTVDERKGYRQALAADRAAGVRRRSQPPAVTTLAAASPGGVIPSTPLRPPPSGESGPAPESPPSSEQSPK